MLGRFPAAKKRRITQLCPTWTHHRQPKIPVVTFGLECVIRDGHPVGARIENERASIVGCSTPTTEVNLSALTDQKCRRTDVHIARIPRITDAGVPHQGVQIRGEARHVLSRQRTVGVGPRRDDFVADALAIDVHLTDIVNLDEIRLIVVIRTKKRPPCWNATTGRKTNHKSICKPSK